MPDDSLFNFNEPIPEDTPPAEPEGNGIPPAPAGLTQADLAAAMAPLQTQLQQAQQELRDAQSRNTSLEDRLQMLSNQQSQQPKAEEDFLDSFTNNAQGAVEKVAKQQVQEFAGQLTPVLEQTIMGLHTSLMRAKEAEITAEFGPEAWTTHFKPILDNVVSSTRRENPAQLLSSDWLDREVNALKGHKMQDLWSLRENYAKTQAQRENERTENLVSQHFKTHGLTGGVVQRASNGARELTDVDRDYIQSRKQAGQSTDIQELHKLMDFTNKNNLGRGMTEDQWEAYSKATQKQGAQ